MVSRLHGGQVYRPFQLTWHSLQVARWSGCRLTMGMRVHMPCKLHFQALPRLAVTDRRPWHAPGIHCAPFLYYNLKTCGLLRSLSWPNALQAATKDLTCGAVQPCRCEGQVIQVAIALVDPCMFTVKVAVQSLRLHQQYAMPQSTRSVSLGLLLPRRMIHVMCIQTWRGTVST
jgi:hypothetical protein